MGFERGKEGIRFARLRCISKGGPVQDSRRDDGNGVCPPSQTFDDKRERKGGENEDGVLGNRGYRDEDWNEGAGHRTPASRRAFCKIVSFTAAKTSRMFPVSVACVKLPPRVRILPRTGGRFGTYCGYTIISGRCFCCENR